MSGPLTLENIVHFLAEVQEFKRRQEPEGAEMESHHGRHTFLNHTKH